MSIRVDRGIRVRKVTRTDEGYLHGDAVITRAGVFKYLSENGTPRFELRHPDDVFKEDSLSTLKMKPVTNRHPWFGVVKSDNSKQVQIGMTGETVSVENPYIISSIIVTDAKSIRDIDAGIQQLSAGYKCDVVEESGVFEGKPYQYRQKNIKYNHVALCEVGRAGEVARLNLDSEDDLDILVTDSEDSQSTRSRPMVKLVLDSCEYEVPQEVLNGFNKLRGDNADLVKQVGTITTEKDTLKAEFDTTKVKLDAFEKRDFAKEMADAVQARLALVTSVSDILPKETKLDSMSDLEIKTAVVAKEFPTLKLDDKNETYISACFEAAVVSKKDQKRADAAAANRAKSTPADKNDAVAPDQRTGSGKAMESYKERTANAYKVKK